MNSDKNKKIFKKAGPTSWVILTAIDLYMLIHNLNLFLLWLVYIMYA